MGISYHQINYWTSELGLVEARSINRATGEPSTGQGSRRFYGYKSVLKLALIKEMHVYLPELEAIGELLFDPPDGLEVVGWEGAMAEYDLRRDGHIFHAVLTKGEPLDLVRSEQELLGALIISVGTLCINLGALKLETDDSIRRVLSTGG